MNRRPMGRAEDPEPIARPGICWKGWRRGASSVCTYVPTTPTAQQMRSHLCFPRPVRGAEPVKGAGNCALSHIRPAADNPRAAPLYGRGELRAQPHTTRSRQRTPAPGSPRWNAHVPASGIAAATNFPFAAALSSASRSRSSAAAARSTRPAPRTAAPAGACWRRPASSPRPGAPGAPATRRRATRRCPAGARRAAAHGEQHGPPVQHRRHRAQLGHRHEPLFDEERQEVVTDVRRAGPHDGPRGLDDERGVQLAADQDESAGDAEHGLLGHGLGGHAVGVDRADGALELLLGDLDDLRGQAGGVGEGEDGGLGVADEQDGAGALLFRVARGAAGRAVVTARGVLSGEQPVGFFVAGVSARTSSLTSSMRGTGGSSGCGAWRCRVAPGP